MNIFCFYSRQILIMLIVLFIVLQNMLPSKLSIFPVLCNLIGIVINTKIRVHGNTDGFNNDNLLIMANHYDGIIDLYIPSEKNDFKKMVNWASQLASTNKDHIPTFVPNCIIDKICVING